MAWLVKADLLTNLIRGQSSGKLSHNTGLHFWSANYKKTPVGRQQKELGHSTWPLGFLLKLAREDPGREKTAEHPRLCQRGRCGLFAYDMMMECMFSCFASNVFHRVYIAHCYKQIRQALDNHERKIANFACTRIISMSGVRYHQ